jgi:hypothetical protein
MDSQQTKTVSESVSVKQTKTKEPMNTTTKNKTIINHKPTSKSVDEMYYDIKWLTPC